MSDEKALMVVNPETLIAQAIEKGVPIETMEKLLAMRRELKAEWSKEEYFKALASFQQACPEIKKTKTVYNKNSITVRYRYAPLEAIIEQCKNLLKENGFSYNIRSEQKPESVTAICATHHIAGHSEESALEIPIDPDGYMNVAQRVASALTYAKRYAFNNAFGIMTGDEDDDSIGTETDKEVDEEVVEETDKNGKKIWPEDWKPIVEDIKKIVKQKHFEKKDRDNAWVQCLKCKSTEDLKSLKGDWILELDKRVAEHERLDEIAGKALDEGEL